MALPVTISGAAYIQLNSFPGIYKAPNGQYYTVLVETTGNTPEVFMATDPTSSFTAQDTGNNPTAVPISMWATIDGADIHIATVQDDNPELQYHVFHTATDLWDGTIVDETVENIATRPDTTRMTCSIAVRSDGDVIILYNGDTDADMGQPYERVDYARREGGSWTTGTAVGKESPVTEDHIGSVVTRGASDKMHFFWWDGELIDSVHRSLDSSNSLTASEIIDATVDSPINLHTNAVYYDDAGVARITVAYGDDDVPLPGHLNSAIIEDDGSPDTPDDISGADVLSGGSLAVNEKTVYAVYALVASGLIIAKKNTEDAGWGTTGGAGGGGNSLSGEISCNFYQRGTNLRLAYIFDDSGTVTYDEYDLGAAPVVPGPILRRIPRPFEIHNLAR